MNLQLYLLTLLITLFSSVCSAESTEAKVGNYFEKIKNHPVQMHQFLQSMPKGGDLHNHAAGATFAENMLHYARHDNFCVDRTTYTVLEENDCRSADRLMVAIMNPLFRNQLIDSWSMRHFKSGKESGHDHFFATFSKFGLIYDKHQGEIVSEIVQRAALQHALYVELMMTADNNESGQLGKKLGWNPDFDVMRNKLLAADFQKIITKIRQNLDDIENKKNQFLFCQSTKFHQKGCNTTIRYLYQVLREQSPEMVFAQLLAGFEAAKVDSRVVGINLVQPEDGKISMRDYALQMQMIHYLHKQYPQVKISLHAGELNTKVSPPEGLKFHIRDAVQVAKANRIGHGVDIKYETNFDNLLKQMAANHVLVEINLSSNALILEIEGKEHPLPLYLSYKVPVALSTDDEAINREDLTQQYIRAVNNFDLSYSQLKTMVRNSIQYAFIAGDSLWEDDNYRYPNSVCSQLNYAKPSHACRVFLKQNEKAYLQWKLEQQFLEFEKRF